LELGTERRAGAIVVERSRLLGRTVLTTADSTRLRAGDVIVTDVEGPDAELAPLRLEELESTGRFFDGNSRYSFLDFTRIGRPCR
jgi:hypothetical protein